MFLYIYNTFEKSKMLQKKKKIKKIKKHEAAFSYSLMFSVKSRFEVVAEGSQLVKIFRPGVFIQKLLLDRSGERVKISF